MLTAPGALCGEKKEYRLWICLIYCADKIWQKVRPNPPCGQKFRKFVRTKITRFGDFGISHLTWLSQVLCRELKPWPEVLCLVSYSCGQSKSSNLITWEWEFLWKFWLQIRNQGPRKHSKKVSPYFSHTFLGWPNFWAFSAHVTHPKVSHISCIWINSVQFVTLSK